VLLLGPSGCGKSSLLAALAGLMPEEVPGELTGTLIRPPILPAMVFQDPETQLCAATVAEDIVLALENAGLPRPTLQAAASAGLEAVALPGEFAGRLCLGLSGGERQRVALAGALMAALHLGAPLLLDEATTDLDEAAAIAFFHALGKAGKQGRQPGWIATDHRLENWLPFATRLIVLGSNGTLVADGPPVGVLADLDFSALGLRQPLWLRQHQQGAFTLEGIRPPRPAARAPTPLARHEGLVLYPGEVLALTGSNGSGKTRLARRLAASQPRQAAMLFQNPELGFTEASVAAQLALNLPVAAVPARLAAINLADAGERHPMRLSHGQKRRLALDGLLAGGRPLLILDEPSNGLDAAGFDQLVSGIRDAAAAGRAVLLISHDGELVDRTAHWVAALQPDGRIREWLAENWPGSPLLPLLAAQRAAPLPAEEALPC
jgi:energy-coupling factor transporter ATP-binding protein EcfA2